MSVRIFISGVALVCVGGCTQDFEQYTPPADGGSADSGPADSGSVDARPDVSQGDAACTPLQSCISTATSCNDQCRNQRNTCRNGCPTITDGGFDTCRDACDKTRDVCRTGCETACNTCTTNAGCAGPSQCKNAVN